MLFADYQTSALRNSTLGCFIVGRASRLPLNKLRSQAGRPRHFRKVQKRTSFGIRQFLNATLHGLHTRLIVRKLFLIPSLSVSSVSFDSRATLLTNWLWSISKAPCLYAWRLSFFPPCSL